MVVGDVKLLAAVPVIVPRCFSSTGLPRVGSASLSRVMDKRGERGKGIVCFLTPTRKHSCGCLERGVGSGIENGGGGG